MHIKTLDNSNNALLNKRRKRVEEKTGGSWDSQPISHFIALETSYGFMYLTLLKYSINSYETIK